MTSRADREELSFYDELAAADLRPLWTQRADLMPRAPAPAAVAHVWKWRAVYPLVVRAAELVPVGRGGERRAIALANPGLHGAPYATPTLWAALQCLGPFEAAPDHRHSQSAFRFVLDGHGVWTEVDGDPVEMRRGDLLLTAGWAWHGHHNSTDQLMVWLDGLDIPLVHYLDAGFFETSDARGERNTPAVSRSERLWGRPGLRPLSAAGQTSPLAAYRWEHTDAALTAQLELDAEGDEGAVERGHAAVRFTNPATGSDALATMRLEMHRLRAGASTAPGRYVGSTVWHVFQGSGTAHIGDDVHDMATGDTIAVPSWVSHSFAATDELDLFCFSDAPVMERLQLDHGGLQ